MKILLAVDGSVYTKRMLDYIATHAELLGPEHEYLLCTVVMAIPPHAARNLDHAMVDSYYHDQAQEVLRPLEEFAVKQGWRTRTCHAVGHAAEMIAATAQAQAAELIVMGTHGHSALSNVVLGSVTTGVLAHSKLPVLLVR
ncbi:MAG: universal stress protein [Pseudomonadota bacterium]